MFILHTCLSYHRRTKDKSVIETGSQRSANCDIFDQLRTMCTLPLNTEFHDAIISCMSIRIPPHVHKCATMDGSSSIHLFFAKPSTWIIAGYHQMGPRKKNQWNMMTSSNGNIFRVTGPLSPVTGEFPSQRPVTRSFDIFFDLRLNKRLSKQSLGWWFETPSPSLWRHCNDQAVYDHLVTMLFAHFDNQYAFYSPLAAFK